jgi:hypothetical protein
LKRDALALQITRVQSMYRGHRERTQTGVTWIRSVSTFPFSSPAEALLVHRAAVVHNFERIVDELIGESIIPELLAEVITEDLEEGQRGGAGSPARKGRGARGGGAPPALRSVLVLPEIEMTAMWIYEEVERNVVAALARSAVQQHVDSFVEDYLRRSRRRDRLAREAAAGGGKYEKKAAADDGDGPGGRRLRVAGALSLDPLDAATMELVDEMCGEEVQLVVREAVQELVAEHIVAEHFDVWLRHELVPIVAAVAEDAIAAEVVEEEAEAVLSALVDAGVRRCAVDTVAELAEQRQKREAAAIVAQAQELITKSLALERLARCFATKANPVMLRKQSSEFFHAVVSERLAAKLLLQTAAQRALAGNALLRDAHRRIAEEACFETLLGVVESDLLAAAAADGGGGLC